MKPRARDQGVLVQPLPDETLVYDLERHKAHCLNRTASLVWGYCDGRTTVAEMARRLKRELDGSADEEMVWMALARLQKARLLEKPAVPAVSRSRREALRRVGLAALLPAITSIVAPTAALAVTCLPIDTGQPCLPSQCGAICGQACNKVCSSVSAVPGGKCKCVGGGAVCPCTP